MLAALRSTVRTPRLPSPTTSLPPACPRTVDPTREASNAARERADVVVVGYRTPGLTLACVRSALADPDVARVVVVDNSPDDDTIAVLETWRGSTAVAADRLVVLHRPDNPGFGAAAGVGIEAGALLGDPTPAVLVVNADTVLPLGVVAGLLDHLRRHPEVALVGPRLVDPGGAVQPSVGRAPTPARVLLQQSGAWRLLDRVPGIDVRPFVTPVASCAVPWVLGAAVLVRRADMDAVGGFDPGFTLYYEEVDLCTRLRAAGREVHHVAEVSMVHVGGASTGDRNPVTERLLYRSLARYLTLHGPDRRLRQLRAVVAVVALAHLVRAQPGSRRPWVAVLGDAARGWPA